jgi:hypothetical protein
MEPLSMRNTVGDTPLHRAVRGGQPGCVRVLCEFPGPVLGKRSSARNNAGETPLTLAPKPQIGVAPAAADSAVPEQQQSEDSALRISFSDMWEGFDPQDNFFLDLLRATIGSQKAVLGGESLPHTHCCGQKAEGGERKDKVRQSGLTPWRCGQIIAFHNKPPRGVPAMAISMYKISVAIFVRHLNGLAHCMKKAQAVYTEKKYDEGTLVNYRLYPDMFTFARQVQQTTDHARNCAAALAGVEAPALEMNEKTLAELIARRLLADRDGSSGTPGSNND